MSFSEIIGGAEKCLLAEIEPPKGTNLDGFTSAALALKGRVDAVAVADGPSAIMRMTPLAPCRALVERNVETLMFLNGRDRNRISFQGDLLAAWSLGVRSVIVAEGMNPAVGDQPLARSSGDLDLEVMARAVASLDSGRDLAREELDGGTSFLAGAWLDLSDDPSTNARAADRLPALAEAGIRFVVLGPTYDLGIVDSMVEPARRAGVALIGSVMLLKSVAMIRYLNHLSGMPRIPEAHLERMTRSPVKVQAGIEIAADLVRDLRARCRGALLLAIGWGGRMPDLLEILARGG